MRAQVYSSVTTLIVAFKGFARLQEIGLELRILQQWNHLSRWPKWICKCRALNALGSIMTKSIVLFDACLTEWQVLRELLLMFLVDVFG